MLRLVVDRHSSTMGVVRTVIKAGTGAMPRAGQQVTVHCTGYLTAGRKKFWSTLDKNEPFSFIIGKNQVIRGWDDGVMQMQVGEEADLEMSGDFAYGERGFPAWGIPPNAPLTFTIQLLAVK